MKRFNRIIALIMVLAFVFTIVPIDTVEAETKQKVVLRVCNWEEYIDLGDWDEDEVIDLESGDIFGENSLVDDFEEWYEETYGIEVEVQYSTFGTNEDLYNMLTLGDVYDVVCPSEYMIMKLMSEDKLVQLSDDFFNKEDENNYYVNGVSPYIENIFKSNEINGETWDKYAAGYMWGVTGVVYDPNVVSDEDASTWHIFENEKYRRQITIKDNVRDSYFSAVGAVKSDLLMSEEFLNDPNYVENLKTEMNDVSPETIAAVEDYLKSVKDNLYSFETDSGKADMISGKVLVNYQWSGDAVYIMDQADEDDFELKFAVPEESTNIYFDGWVMLKAGISQDPLKQHAAESFINFVSRPDNAVRNMYYIGYTSVISGGDDERILEYIDWNFGADEDEEETIDHNLAYFFTDDAESEDYIITASADQINRQLYAQYPTEETIHKASIMVYFNESVYEDINQMWTNIRCYDLRKVPKPVWAISVVAIVFLILIFIQYKRRSRV